MRSRLRLSTKVFLVGFLNLILLAAIFAGFVRAQLGLDLESFLLEPARDRILATTRLLALQLQEAGADSRDRLLADYTARHGFVFTLFRNEGEQLAGPKTDLPRDVFEELSRRAPPGRRPPFEETEPQRPGPDAGKRGPFPPRNAIFMIRTSNPTRYWIGVRVPFRIGDTGDPIRATLMLVSPSLLGNSLFFDFKLPLLVIAGVMVVSILCWLPLIRGVTKSLSEMTQVTERIAEGDFAIHIRNGRGDELGQLGSAINRMAGRLSGFVKGQRRFLGDIAHELCSPLARMQLSLGILERRAEESQRSPVLDLREEIEHMSSLVNELLSFSKAGMQPARKNLAPVNVAETVRRVIDREGFKDSRIDVSVDERLAVLADPDYLFRSLANLLRNAIRYAGQSGPISISAAAAKEQVSIVVADQGPGLPADALEDVFAPFYRPELARTRDTGGVGLGLAIVKTCVESCQGTVQCRNRVPRGLEVEIRLQAA